MLSRIRVLPVSRRIAALGNLLIGMIIAVAIFGMGTALFLRSEMNSYKLGQTKLELAFGILQDAYQAEVGLLGMDARTAGEKRAVVEAEISEVREGITAIMPLVQGDAEAEIEFGHTSAAFADFETAYGALSAAVDRTAEAAVFTELLGVAVAAADLVAVEADMLKDAFEEDMSKIAAQTELTIYIALGILAVLGAASVAVAAVTSRHIASGLADEIEQSVAQTRALAAGDLAAEISGTDRPGELGELARALLVFRDNAVEAKQLEAAARQREADLRAQEERQSEMRRDAAEQAARDREETRRAMIVDLAEKVGVVVKAAADGDYSRRIDARLSDPELDDMARSINALVANVETAVAEAAEVMAALSDGDVTRVMQGNFRGSFARLQGDINGSLQRLGEMVSGITSRCDDVTVAAEAMRSQSSDLAKRAEQQAASLEETSATMEEIRQSVSSSTKGAADAAEFAQKATERVQEAGEVVSAAVEAMAQISAASKSINDIVSVIDGIAFQTNLLALNAGVEAARAGDSGRGFAVVASEVRALAQRSSDASKDIRALIEESANRVEDGVALVERTGRSLNDILKSVTQMSEIMQNLTGTAQEQASNIGYVTDVIGRLDTITQKNAGLADATSSTAAEMQGKVTEMRRVVGAFRVAGSSRSPSVSGTGSATGQEPISRVAAE